MQPGDLVELPGSEGPVVAFVVSEERKKLRLVSEAGASVLGTPGRGWVTLGSAGATLDPTAAAAAALRVAERIRALRAQVDVQAMWELLVDDGERYAVEDLAELALGDTGPVPEAAVRRALDAERVLFRAKREQYEPNSRKAVEEVLAQRAAAQAHAAARAAGVAALSAALVQRRPELAAGHADMLALLEGLAVHGPEYPRAAAAQELMNELGLRVGREPQHKAFDVLARLGHFDSDENLLLRRFKIPGAFRAELLEQAEALAATARPWEDAARIDLEHLLTIAIDDPETTEVDDALSCAPGPGDGWTLWVHIADPGAVVDPESELGREAGRRAATLYLPEGKTTMFPPLLAEGCMSLSEGQPRAALTLRAELDELGGVVRAEFLQSRVRLDRRLSYEEADRLAEEPGPIGDLLQRLLEATDAREALRRRDGATLLVGAEVKVRVAADGRIRVQRLDPHVRSRSMVAETMILVGTCAGQLLASNALPATYRRQDPPQQELNLPEGPLDPASFYAAVKTMRRAELSRIPGRHAGLGVEPYVQITSPIRRWTDLVLQQQLRSFLQQGAPRFAEEDLLRVLGPSEQTQANLTFVERQRTRFWVLRYLQGFRGRSFDAAVLEQRRPGNYLVELTELCLRATLDAPPDLPAGAALRVEVGSVDARRDTISLRFTERL